MIYADTLTKLLSKWEGRLDDPKKYNMSYRDAVSDCIYDLRKAIDDSFDEEIKDWEMNHFPDDEILQNILQQEAEMYEASVEAHERVS